MSNDLMQAILRDPADTLAREVYAEEIERDEPERAEFIRLQVAFSSDRNCDLSRRISQLIDNLQVPAKMLGIGPDWSWSGDCESAIVTPNDGKGTSYTFSRGFPSAISCTMALLMGGSECRNCGGAGDVLHPTHYRQPCKECGDGKTNGTGRTPALIDTIFSQWPVTEVRLTDREPWYEHGYGGEYCWWRESEWYSLSNDQTGNITDELFDKIAELHPDNRLSWGGPAHNQHIGFDSRDAALLALSHAIVDLGRERAGQPAIRRGQS